ncbi:hypothetical protein MZO42_08090 [Sphingomonas psychrotolerans]|uniref:Uncharacterized protein n=1 Tax=Sphingomonas psychrotolerans TaxID=1327635 RepID=A0ABU3N282_9SPHN|nr:hypothetical protein [Sphingomonas psychrotolerans]
MRVGALVLPLLLAGCGGPGGEPEANRSVVLLGNDNELIVPVPDGANASNAVETTALAVKLAPDGLAVGPAGGVREAQFGMARAAVMPIVTGALGDPLEQIDNQECGAGALGVASFRDGLGLYFQGDRFVGWDLDGGDGGRFATAGGIGIGATRKQLEAAGPVTVEDSTLGIEFSAGGMSGLLSARDSGGTVTNLWAGTTCIAR